MILNAFDNTDLTLFVVDPLGMDVIDENCRVPDCAPGTFAAAAWLRVRGASRRALSSTFGGDSVEHSKFLRFFKN